MHLVETGACVSNGSKGATPDGEVILGLPAPGEDVYLVDPVTSSGIVFSRQELLKAQQSDPFCRRIVDGLKEPSSQEERGGYAVGRTRTPGIAVGAECDAAGADPWPRRVTPAAAADLAAGYPGLLFLRNPGSPVTSVVAAAPKWQPRLARSWLLQSGGPRVLLAVP
ncbi:hypothetical protein HPB49_026149 [Dermacentor silvarum]|nr:hypothetical protein HPB49_026149 [Dermacentor silvarum]